MPPKHLNFIMLCGFVSLACYSTYRLIRPAIVVGDALQLVEQYYVAPVETDELVTGAMNGLTSQLDQNSSFIPASRYQSFQNSINQEFAGVGILIEQLAEGEPVRVITPMVGSPALAAGFLPGDRILRVAGTPVSDARLSDVSQLLQGPVGTTVDVTVARGEQEVELTVERQTIQLESVIGDRRNPDNSWIFRLQEDPDIAYIRLTTFGDKTIGELENVLRDLNNEFESIILDLRGNGGGLLPTAVEVCDMFLNEGRVVSTKTRGEVLEEVWEATSGTLVELQKPMVVLIDGDSASASEIVAACMQDHDRAAVVGVRSYGKGTVQNILPLQLGRSALRLTVATYHRPNGENIHRMPDATEDDEWGVHPDPDLRQALDAETRQQLEDRWRLRLYPMLAEAPETVTTQESEQDGSGQNDPADAPEDPQVLSMTDSDPSESNAEPGLAPTDPPPPFVTGDPQLDRAIWHLQGRPEEVSTAEPAQAA